MVGTVMYFTIPGYCLLLCCRASMREVCLIRTAGVGAFPCTPSLSLSSNLLLCRSSCSLMWLTFRCLVRFVVLPQYLTHFVHKSHVASFELTAVKYVQMMLLFRSDMLRFFLLRCDWLTAAGLARVQCTRILVRELPTVAKPDWKRKPDGKVVPYPTHILTTSFTFYLYKIDYRFGVIKVLIFPVKVDLESIFWYKDRF